jgi:asparagine synthase (glutamine-hydrolysing)
VEARHPLLDLDLVGLCLRQPPAATLDRRYSRPVLRRSVAGLVPDAVRLRPSKARFESLVADCLAGSERAAVRELLSGREAAIREYVDQERMERELLDGEGEFELGSFQWMWLVWRLLTAEIWLRAESAGLQLFPTLTTRGEASRIPRNLMVDTVNQKRSSRQ